MLQLKTPPFDQFDAVKPKDLTALREIHYLIFLHNALQILLSQMS